MLKLLHRNNGKQWSQCHARLCLEGAVMPSLNIMYLVFMCFESQYSAANLWFTLGFKEIVQCFMIRSFIFLSTGRECLLLHRTKTVLKGGNFIKYLVCTDLIN